MSLEIGKQYKVTIPGDYGCPEQEEFTGTVVQINRHNTLTHLVYSEELEKQKRGHYGDGYTKYYGCWWCDPKWLEEQPESEPIELDLFKYDSK